MQSDRSKLSVDQTLAACEAITAHVASGSNPYNLTSDDLKSLGDAHDLLAGKAEAQRLGALAQAQKVKDKDAALAAAGATLSTLTKVALASSATAAQLSLIGMARPARPVRPTAIPAPTGLVATPALPSRTVLSWGRNAPYGATFEVFGSSDGLDYGFLGTTTKARLELDAAPGVPAWFKVRAVRAGLASPFSNEASVYAPGLPARPELKVA